MTRIRHFAVVSAATAMLGLGLAGCMHEHPDIPTNAKMEVEGNKTLRYSPTSGGVVTVYNSTTDHVVYSGKVESGQALVVDVDRKKITLDGVTASEDQNLRRGDQYRIYFEPTGTVEKSSTVHTETNTVETSHQ